MYSTTALASGVPHTLTAVYSGDTNFTGSTSGPAVTVPVASLDFTFLDTGASAYTAAPGVVATYSFGLSPLNGTYAAPVSFTVSGLPAGATASFTPSAIAANAGATTVQMAVQTAAPMARNRGDSLGRGIVLALLLLPFSMKRSMRERLKGRMLLVLLLAGATAAMSGCGSSNGFLLQSPQTYTLTVTATNGTLVHNQTVTLNVQ
jgi:large repetitive protein